MCSYVLIFLSALLKATSTSESIFRRKLLTYDLEIGEESQNQFLMGNALMSQSVLDCWELLKYMSWDQAGILGWEGTVFLWEVEVNLGIAAEGQGTTLVSRDILLFRWSGQNHSD